jgi:ABC-type dipeptide/oligopeptide/nickel transport system permease component
MGLRSYMITRILLMIPMIILLITIVFLITRVLPGDPVALHFEKNATPQQLAEVRHILGLDQPIWTQYINYIIGFFTGDLGKSMQDYSPVSQQIFSAFPATLELAIYATIFAALIGIFLGARSAQVYNKPEDHAIRVFGIVTYALPVFFLGMIFQMVFGIWLHVLPVGGRAPPGVAPQGLNIPLSPSPGGFLPQFLLSSLAGLVPFVLLILFFRRKHKTLLRKDLIRSFLVFLVVWLLWALGAWYYTSIGGLRIQTGLYTIDSILEGNPYDFVVSLVYIFLPSLTLGVVLSGVFLRLTRTNMIETLRLDYVTAAKARGLRARTVAYGYALRNAFLPILTMIGLQFAALLGGAVLTETTFNWPGLGRYIVDRINFRDYTAIQSAVVVFGVLVMIVSLVVDLLYAYLDPRVRL